MKENREHKSTVSHLYFVYKVCTYDKLQIPTYYNYYVSKIIQ